MKTIGVIFDGDDTLWSTEVLYDEARAAARSVVAAAYLDAAKWEALERRIDVQNVATFGYSAERFPTSCVQAYERLCKSAGKPIDHQTADLVRQTARSVFERDPSLIPGAREMLTTLRARGTRLALLTKGDPSVQSCRAQRSGLSDLFDIIEIVPEKSGTTIRELVARLGIEIDSAWMVGNSIRSDVIPAIDAGIRAVWIGAHVWEYERAYDHFPIDGVVIASGLADIPYLILGKPIARDVVEFGEEYHNVQE